jgi:nicotinamidase-related amidase
MVRLRSSAPYIEAQKQRMAIDQFAKPALLIVDMQNDFVRIGAPMEVPQARDTITQHRQLIEYFRKARLPIVYTRFLAGPERKLLWEFSPQLAPPTLACHAGHKRFYADIHKTLECMEIIDELAPKAADLLIDKLGYGAFHGTKLDSTLRKLGVDPWS